MMKITKILSIVMLVLMMASFAAPSVYAAAGGTAMTPSDITPDYSGDTTELKQKAGKIMGMIRNIAVIASVIIIMILGVKYMLGSVEEKAEYKKSFMPLIIGIILVVAASSIATFIFNMVA